jgi:hypothetical protein
MCQVAVGVKMIKSEEYVGQSEFQDFLRKPARSVERLKIGQPEA